MNKKVIKYELGHVFCLNIFKKFNLKTSLSHNPNLKNVSYATPL